MPDRLTELRDKWTRLYPKRLAEGDGDGSLFGAAYIIARSACSDIPALLDVAEAAREVGLETVCLLDPPCGGCRACNFRTALARLDGADGA